MAFGELKSEKAEKNEHVLVFIFHDGDQIYAIPPTSVVEVTHRQKVTPVPFTPPWVDGVTSFRGQVVPVLDLSLLFGMRPSTVEDRSRLIAVEIDNQTMAFWSNRIVGVESIDLKDLEQPLVTLPDLLLRCSGHQFRFQEFIVTVLDLGRLRDETIRQVGAA